MYETETFGRELRRVMEEFRATNRLETIDPDVSRTLQALARSNEPALERKRLLEHAAPIREAVATDRALRSALVLLSEAQTIALESGRRNILLADAASHHLRLADLKASFGDDITMAAESEVDRLFADCAHGAVPAAGICYGLDVIVDDSIQMQPVIYVEAGDHETLLHLGRAQFARLTAGSLHGRFSAQD